jgi:Fe-S-cluster-containing dehydrogenase component
MKEKGLLIDYDFCTGCHTCEVACKQANSYPEGRWGIKVFEFVQQKTDSRVEINYLPYPTDLCNLCSKRTEQGELPSCVKHCQADCMRFGDIEELTTELMKKPKQVLFRLK